MNALSPYETGLLPHEEEAFQAWRQTLPPNLQNMDDYDLRGAWKVNAQAATNGHLPDTWKKPNHMTFSSGSKYSQGAQQGGNWTPAGGDNWVFWASPENMRQHNANALSGYFQQYEPSSSVVLPINYNMNALMGGRR